MEFVGEKVAIMSGLIETVATDRPPATGSHGGAWVEASAARNDAHAGKTCPLGRYDEIRTGKTMASSSRQYPNTESPEHGR